ncbi:MAG: dihydroorotase [Oscillospiraceae bacterium]|nr:dihydroorotase [Oscillospiraceae bacterium]
MAVFDKVKCIGTAGEKPVLEGFDDAFSRYNKEEYVLFPGFCDVHVHFREPGFSYKETILTGAQAAAASGYTAVCTMPNLNPVPDSLAHLQPQLDLIREAPVSVLPYGSITVGEKGANLSDLEGLAPYVVGFSDDGVGVADEGLMREAMQRCKALGKLIAGHCEDMRYEDPREREWREIERNIRLADETGCAFHVCHISTAESVSIIREAKRSGVDVTCETAPHYLLLNQRLVQDHGRFKMNPPIHTVEDQAALLEALTDGTVDMIATDHAPHSAEEKSRGFEKSLNGIVGLETAFPTLYSALVGDGILGLEELIALMSAKPRSRFELPAGGDFTIWDLEAEDSIDPARFRSKGRSTPFEGWPVLGRCLLTVHNGKAIYDSEEN